MPADLSLPMLPALTSPRSRGPSPKRPGISGSASFDPAGPQLHNDLHPVIHPGRVAVVTGAASGIGRAAAIELARLGLKVAIADLPTSEAALEKVGNECAALVGAANVLVVSTDVRVLGDVERLRDRVYEAWSEVGVLLNNAAVGAGADGDRGTGWSGLQAWRDVMEVNLFGVLNVQQTFVTSMLHQENQAMIINTGSKQGITNPPGNAAYNASKAAVKSLTEGLAHELRERMATITAHLFVPGYTYTGMTGGSAAASGTRAPPPGAWSAQETVLHMLDRVRAGDFYVLCPDAETTREIDQMRIMWAAADVAQGRPALSRWHRDYKALFEEYMRGGGGVQESEGV
ncbi:hypothetical protein C8J57DRAFT_1405336 [Mycena rebaudengoi]|nr:hypothetical protein C8J57DRAFT_1405336 [Mycena rebaudengoi]